jgi:hypothetical protein
MEGLTSESGSDEARQKLEALFRAALNEKDLPVKLESFKTDELPAMITVEEQSRRFSEMSKVFGGYQMPERRSLVLNARHPLVKHLETAAVSEMTTKIAQQILDLAEMARSPLESDRMVAFLKRRRASDPGGGTRANNKGSHQNLRFGRRDLRFFCRIFYGFGRERLGKYALGIDYGTLSARALVAEIGTGGNWAARSWTIRTGDGYRLPDGTRLPPDWALQHPQDYMEARGIFREALKTAGVLAEDIVGVGLDFTACTMLPVDESFTPLCLKPEWAGNPHAYAKLWKHHAAQREADEINRAARARGEVFLARYGGKTSSEWMFPKIWQILNEAPEVYRASHRFIEAADWAVWLLTGSEAVSACAAGYKALWSRRDGYPSRAFSGRWTPGLRCARKAGAGCPSGGPGRAP